MAHDREVAAAILREKVKFGYEQLPETWLDHALFKITRGRSDAAAGLQSWQRSTLASRTVATKPIPETAAQIKSIESRSFMGSMALSDVCCSRR